MTNELSQTGSGNLAIQNVKGSTFNIHVENLIGKSYEYKDLLKRLKELEENLADVAPDKIERLNALNEKIALQKKNIEQFKQGVLQLAETFSRIDVDTTDRLKRAREFFEKGEFGEARAVMEIELEQMNDEHNLLLAQKERLMPKLKHNAEEFLVLAQTTAMNFDSPSRFADTCRYYEQSIAVHAFFDNLFNYAGLLQEHNQFHLAEPYYQRVLSEFRGEISVENYTATLNNLANLHSNRNELEIAEEEYTKALTIYRELAAKNPQANLPYVATTLNNLGELHRRQNEYEEAEKEFTEALAIRRELAEKNPQNYLPKVAVTLNNLAILHRAQNELEAAESEHREALTIRRKLAEKNPQAYLPDVAMTLNNLAILHRRQNEHEAAEKENTESLALYRELAAKNPQAYLSYVATTLNNLAILHKHRNEFEAAEKEYTEALGIYRELAERNPQAYLPDVAMTLGNQAIFYQESKPDKERSIALAIEAARIIQPFIEQAPYTLEYLKIAVAVLGNWELTDEEILEKLEQSEGEKL
jgi:tetratricopeptide (TPR) repeat protein